MRVLVDTCVIVDALQDRKPFSDNAKTIFYAVANKQIDGYISAKSITDITKTYLTHLIGGKTMMQIDSAILATDKVICKNISRFDDSERGLLSQNILSQLRNFVEYIADKVYANGSDLDPNNYALNVEALKYLQTRGDLRFLHQFHELLQKSVSHYTLDENGSERLMLKYYEYLLKIKIFLNLWASCSG